MIEGTMDWLTPQTEAEFEALLSRNARDRRWTGLILTGSEITLNRGLPSMAQRARASGFSHVRIQTHGMHLANADFAARLVDAGVDEFFISVTAGSPGLHDEITGRPGAFDRIVRGMHNLDDHDVVMITNTVLTTSSYLSAPMLVDALSDLKRLRQMEFWNYWPMQETDHKGQIVRYADLLPVLFTAIERAQALGRRVEVKNVPHCLLGAHKDVLVNDQPELMIDPRFWDEFGRNGFDQCLYRAGCGSSQCLGLNTAYVAKFGWEAETLSPMRVH
jgi:MoaA/NifB/PqqE/SkfB family radical SAM enzyme